MPINISIQTGSSVSIYRQIVDQICTAVVGNRIGDDEALPSVRALAEQLVINPNTVARAYGELVREGVLESRAGRGMYVASRRQIYSRAERARRVDQSLTSFVSEALMLGFSRDEIVDHVQEKVDELTAPRRQRPTPKGGSR
jgi:GntR family transcriptional regulator